MSKGVIMIPPTAGRGGPTPRYRASGLRTCVKTSRLEEGVAVEPFVAPATRTRAISPPIGCSVASRSLGYEGARGTNVPIHGQSPLE